MEWRMLGIGSPFAERCHLALRPGLTGAETSRALDELLACIQQEARRVDAPLVAVKDLAEPEAGPVGAALARRGFHAIPSLPVAALALESGDPEAYLTGLSAATRKDLRRKMRRRGDLCIEHRHRIGELAPEIDRLYEATRDNSLVHYGDFEELPAGYFGAISEALGDRALFVLYRIGGQLAAFNLLLLEPGRVIDKFLGMDYALARQHNLYAVSWMENVRIAAETGSTLLQSGQTAYASKLRFGSHLVPSTNHAWHRHPLANRAIGMAAPWLAFDRWDPDLRALAQRRAG
jgi:predicted N-acyltransferase